MDRASSDRSTYLGSPEYDLDEVLDQIEEIRLKEPTCQRVLAALEENQRLLDAPQLNQMYPLDQDSFLENSKELIKLLQVCVQPEALNIHNRSWPLLSRNLLLQEPPFLLEEVLKHTDTGRYLFGFLRHHPNETARGYFLELLHFVENDFQDKLLSFLMMDHDSLELCISTCRYPEVYSFLFKIVAYCSDSHREFAIKEVLAKLLSSIEDPKYSQDCAENLLGVMEEVHRNYERLIKSTGEEEDIEPLRNYCLRIFTMAIKCWTPEYMDKIIDICLECWKEDERKAEVLLQIFTEHVKAYQMMPQLVKKLELPGGNPMENCVVKLLQKLHLLTEILRQQPKTMIRDSTGEQIRCVGMLRFHMLELLEVVLRVDPNLISTHYDLNKNGVLKVLQKYITMNPWNNQIHLKVEAILINLINSFDRYTELEENYIGPDGFLGFLIETFRNHEFIFLASSNPSCNIINYGYMQTLYNIARAVIIKLDQSKNLKAVMSGFKPWEDFILKDLQKFEAQMDIDLGGQAIQILAEKRKSKGASIRRIVVDLARKDLSEVSQQNEDVTDQFFEVDYITAWPGLKRPDSNAHHRRNTVGTEKPRFDETALSPTKGSRQNLKKTNSQIISIQHSDPELKVEKPIDEPVLVEHKYAQIVGQAPNLSLQTIPEQQQMVEAILNFALDKKVSALSDTALQSSPHTAIRRGLSEPYQLKQEQPPKP